MAIKDKVDVLDWTTDLEVQLFYAMKGHKPVGVNRHFQMALVHDRFNNSINREVSTSQLWDHLCTMYDMDALNESEIIPFPNKSTDFSLPEADFGGIMEKKEQVKPIESAVNESKSTLKTSNSTPKSSNSTPKVSNSTPKVSNSTPKASTSTSKLSNSSTKQSASSSDTPEPPKRKGRPPKHKIDDPKPASPASSGAKRKR